MRARVASSGESFHDPLMGDVALSVDALGVALSITSTPWPARSAASGAWTPALSHNETAAWRRSYGRAARGEAT